jgi:uncharacterized protein YndB with AHSA1/START domain
MPVITVQTTVNAPMAKVWDCWTSPQHITGWSFASDDWEARDPENELRLGGKFKTTLGAKDGSMSFDFGGVYTALKENALIEYDMDDARHVKIEFTDTPEGVRVVEAFDAEASNPVEMQQAGWQAFLDNFKKYVESR